MIKNVVFLFIFLVYVKQKISKYRCQSYSICWWLGICLICRHNEKASINSSLSVCISNL